MNTLLLLLALAFGDPVPEAELAPRPYTTEQIRDHFAAGSVIKFRLHSAEGDILRRTEFTAVTDDTCTMSTINQALDGTPLILPQVTTVPWSDLRDHASWPAKEIVRTEGSVTVAIGTFDAWIYTHSPANAPGQTITYWFAKDLPGPPVKVSAIDKGVEVETMELIERK